MTPDERDISRDVDAAWDSFFLGDHSVVTSDFLEERAGQDQPEREGLVFVSNNPREFERAPGL